MPEKDGVKVEPPFTMGEDGSKYQIKHRAYKGPTFQEAYQPPK
jgi:hypothetical protein